MWSFVKVIFSGSRSADVLALHTTSAAAHLNGHGSMSSQWNTLSTWPLRKIDVALVGKKDGLDIQTSYINKKRVHPAATCNSPIQTFFNKTSLCTCLEHYTSQTSEKVEFKLDCQPHLSSVYSGTFTLLNWSCHWVQHILINLITLLQLGWSCDPLLLLHSAALSALGIKKNILPRYHSFLRQFLEVLIYVINFLCYAR